MSPVRQRARSSRWVAIAAAYLLVLQAVVAGLASGAHAAGMSLDRSLAMTLCAPGAMPASGSDTGTARHDLMTCCIQGCAGTGGGEPAASGPYLPVVHRAIDRVAFAHRRDAPLGFVGGRSPANPRAPPSAS